MHFELDKGTREAVSKACVGTYLLVLPKMEFDVYTSGETAVHAVARQSRPLWPLTTCHRWLVAIVAALPSPSPANFFRCGLETLAKAQRNEATLAVVQKFTCF